MRLQPTTVVRVLAPITLDHIALQAELLVNEIRQMRENSRMDAFLQSDIDQLHRLVANALLFIDAGPHG